MYSVVGCSACSALWIVDGRPETTQCPRCGTRRKFETLRTFVETEEADVAKEIRGAMLADRDGEREAFDSMGSFAELEDEVDRAGMDDDEYLERVGIDTDAVAAASERVAGGPNRSSGSRKDTVLAALGDLDAPTEEAVVEYACERGVDAEYVRTALEKLRRAGRVSESGGRYRLL